VRFTIVRGKITVWQQMWYKPPGRAAIRWRPPRRVIHQGSGTAIAAGPDRALSGSPTTRATRSGGYPRTGRSVQLRGRADPHAPPNARPRTRHPPPGRISQSHTQPGPSHPGRQSARAESLGLPS
jgi:hypothetical protein